MRKKTFRLNLIHKTEKKKDLSYLDTDLCLFFNLLCLVNIQAWQLDLERC